MKRSDVLSVLKTSDEGLSEFYASLIDSLRVAKKEKYLVDTFFVESEEFQQCEMLGDAVVAADILKLIFEKHERLPHDVLNDCKQIFVSNNNLNIVYDEIFKNDRKYPVTKGSSHFISDFVDAEVRKRIKKGGADFIESIVGELTLRKGDGLNCPFSEKIVGQIIYAIYVVGCLHYDALDVISCKKTAQRVFISKKTNLWDVPDLFPLSHPALSSTLSPTVSVKIAEGTAPSSTSSSINSMEKGMKMRMNVSEGTSAKSEIADDGFANFVCNECGEDIYPDESRYHCTICDDFDLCKSCYCNCLSYKSNPSHSFDHRMQIFARSSNEEEEEEIEIDSDDDGCYDDGRNGDGCPFPRAGVDVFLHNITTSRGNEYVREATCQCKECLTSISPWTSRYHCTVCANLDLCSKCKEKKRVPTQSETRCFAYHEAFFHGH